MEIIERCKNFLRNQPGTVAFPDCLDTRLLEAAARLKHDKVVEPVLVQSPFAVRSKLSSLDISPGVFAVTDPRSPRLLERNTEIYMELQNERGRPTTVEEAREMMADPLAAAAMMVRCGDVEVGIAGNLSSTANVLRAGLRIIPKMKGVSIISSFFLMMSPGEDRYYIFADCAVVPEPTSETLAEIAITTAATARTLLPEDPKVALLSFSTRSSAVHPRSEMVREAVEIVRSRAPDIDVDGELQFDAAAVPEISALKAPDSILRGEANVFIFPSLEAGNIAYKMVERLAGYIALGPFLQGFDGGWHDLSRGCSARDIFDIAVLGTCLRRGDVMS